MKNIITKIIVALPVTRGKNTAGLYNNHAVKYFTACGVDIVDASTPHTNGRLTFVISDTENQTVSRLDATTFSMSYRQLVRLYDKALILGPGFVKVIRAFTRALFNADLISIEQISVESITDTFDYIITDIIERNGISGNILSSKNIHLLLKKFGGTKGLTKLFEESIDASMDYCLLGISPSKVVHNKCTTCSSCRIVDGIRTCDDGYVRVGQNEDLSRYPSLQFSAGKIYSEYLFSPQTRCNRYHPIV